MAEVNRLAFAHARLSVFEIQAGRTCRLLAVALLVVAVEFASCQADSARFSTQVPSDHELIVSKNQLLTPEKAQKAINRARKEFLRGHFEPAQKEIRRALDIWPHCALALTIQGALNLQNRDYPEAAHAFQRAIEEDPSSGAAYLGLGIVFNTQGRFKEAIVPLDRAAHMLPDSWLFHFQNAFAHLGVGEFAVGLKDITSAEQFAGEDPEKLSGMAFLRGIAHLQMKDISGAQFYLQEAIRHDPSGGFSTLARRRLEQLRTNVSRVQ